MVFLNNDGERVVAASLGGAKGFTLIEVLVSMMLMIISLTVIMGLFSGGLRSKSVSDDYNRAVALARNRMEEVLSLPLEGKENLEGSVDDRYHWRVEIIKQDKEEEDGKVRKNLNLLHRVTVEVTWTGRSGEKRYILTTQQAELRNVE